MSGQNSRHKTQIQRNISFSEALQCKQIWNNVHAGKSSMTKFHYLFHAYILIMQQFTVKKYYKIVTANSPTSSKVIMRYICNMHIKQTYYKLKDTVHMISPMPISVQLVISNATVTVNSTAFPERAIHRTSRNCISLLLSPSKPRVTEQQQGMQCVGEYDIKIVPITNLPTRCFHIYTHFSPTVTNTIN